jgi:predicted  nucleic acid-binding Zn-ribbon protein
MSDENQDTLHLPSFEEKVLAQLGSLDSRLASLEKREEERDYDTKPIWNRVLTELSDLNTKVTDLDTKVTDLDTKVTELDKHMGNFDRKLDIMNKELLQVKADQRGLEMR